MMGLQVIIKTILISGFLLSLMACTQVGPSDKKVELDVKQRWEYNFYGLISADVLAIDEKDVLSEDRIIYKLTMRFTRTVKKLNARVGLRIMNQMGGVGSEAAQHIGQFLRAPAGASEKTDGIIAKFRLQRGEWILEKK